MPPWLAAAAIVPAFFLLGVGLHVVFAYFRVTEFTSLLVTFGLTVILESLIQWFWTADFRRYETPYATASFRAGAALRSRARAAACLTAAVLALGHLGLAALHLRGQGAAGERGGPGHGRRLRRQPPGAGVPALRGERGLRGDRRARSSP